MDNCASDNCSFDLVHQVIWIDGYLLLGLGWIEQITDVVTGSNWYKWDGSSMGSNRKFNAYLMLVDKSICIANSDVV